MKRNGNRPSTVTPINTRFGGPSRDSISESHGDSVPFERIGRGCIFLAVESASECIGSPIVPCDFDEPRFHSRIETGLEGQFRFHPDVPFIGNRRATRSAGSVSASPPTVGTERSRFAAISSLVNASSFQIAICRRAGSASAASHTSTSSARSAVSARSGSGDGIASTTGAAKIPPLRLRRPTACSASADLRAVRT